jgi:hypothetical protein
MSKLFFFNLINIKIIKLNISFKKNTLQSKYKMDAFKFKPDKIKHRTEITSLDTEHRKFMAKIKKWKQEKETKMEKMENLKKKLEEHDLHNVAKSNYIQVRTKILDEIEKIENFLETYEYEESNYYLKTNTTILEYYELNKPFKPDISNKENVSTNNEDENNKVIDTLHVLNAHTQSKKKEKKNTKKRITVQVVKSKNIFDFIDSSESNKTNDGDSSIKEPKKMTKNDLYTQYKTVLEPTIIKNNIDFCEICKCEKISFQTEGILTCPNCMTGESNFVDLENTNYKDAMVIKPIFPYDRKNHFDELTTAHKCKYLKVFASVLNFLRIFLKDFKCDIFKLRETF